MKYFTNELWEKVNNPATRVESLNIWKKNMMEYNKRFDNIKHRVPAYIYKFFSKNSFHDFRLQDIRIIHSNYGYKFPIKVELFLTNNDETWSITYKKIKKINVNFECEDNDIAIRRGFDDWGYDEILDHDEEHLSHEILFASGSTISIYFKNKNISLKKL